MLAQVLHNFSNTGVLVLCSHIMIYHSFDCPPKAITYTFAMTGDGIYPRNGNMEEMAIGAQPHKQSGTAEILSRTMRKNKHAPNTKPGPHPVHCIFQCVASGI